MSCSIYAYGCQDDYEPKNSCQCNAACKLYADCCDDFNDVCGEQKVSVFGIYTESTLIYACVVVSLFTVLFVWTMVELLRKHLKDKSAAVSSDSESSSSSTKKLLTKDHKFVVVSGVLCILFYWLCSIAYVVSAVGLFEKNDQALEMYSEAQAVAIILWSCGYAFMYGVMVGRLFFTFNYTPYATKKYMFFLLAFLFVCATVAMIVFNIEFNSNDWNNYILLSCIVIGFGIHILFSCIVIFLYVRTLFKLAVVQNESLLDINNSLNNNDDTQKMTEDQQALMEYTTRMTLLSVIANASSIVSFVMWAIFFGEEDEAQGGQGTTFEILSVCWWLLPADALVNTLCVFFNFEFAKIYYKTMCVCGHRCCSVCCLECATKMMANDTDAAQKPNYDTVETHGHGSGGGGNLSNSSGHEPEAEMAAGL